MDAREMNMNIFKRRQMVNNSNYLVAHKFGAAKAMHISFK